MHRLALPLTRLGNSLAQRLCQPIDVGNIIAIDRPGLRFLLRSRWFAVDDNPNALAIRKELFFDASQLLPAHLNHFSVTATLDECLRLQRNRKWDGGNDAQEDGETDNQQQCNRRAAY